MHRTGKDRPCRQYCNINQSQHFHTFHACIQTGTVSISPLLRKDRSISFRNTGHFRHHIRSSPRRTTHILINLIPLDHRRRPYRIYILSIPANNARLLYLTVHPLIHVPERNHLNFMLRHQRQGRNKCNETCHQQAMNAFLNHQYFSFLFLLIIYNPIVSKQNPSSFLPIESYGRHIYIYSSYIPSFRPRIFLYRYVLQQIRG